MNKIITLYELLGLIINKELKENTLIKMSYKDGSVDNYCRYKDGKFVVYYDEGKSETDGCLDIINYLKHHDSFIVEILDDEDKEKNKIPTEEEMKKFGYNVAKIFKAYEKGVRMALEENNDIEELTYESTFEDNSDMEVQEVLLSKINELVREINKLKKEGK